MNIIFGLLTIWLLAVAVKVAKADIKFYNELYSEDLTNENEGV